MTDDDNASSAGGGGPSLDGYLYQMDVSIWAALDLLLAKRIAQQLVLEPASKEDLEATLLEEEPGRLTAKVDLNASKLLVVQAKLRNTGPWKVGGLASLLEHGTDRRSAAQRLNNSQIHYLLVTSADVDGVARSLRLNSFGASPKTTKLPPTIAKVVPGNAGGRIGILANADPERVEWKLRELLEGAFRVPHSRLEACKSALREAALERMRGIGGGIWTREAVEEIIRAHDGYLATSLEAETFVKPTNWTDLKSALTENNAVIITGASGTGKTTAATVLVDQLRADIPGITPVHILHGPEEVRADNHAEPVVFVIEDPWGKYRLEPRSAPWNDEIDKLLATANGNRRFVITSRSDVLAESRTKTLSKKWNVTLEAENYGPKERQRLFENRLPALPRPFHRAAVNYRAAAINRLRSPLEMQKYFDNLAEGPVDDENEGQFCERCLTAAHRDAIEDTIVQQVNGKEAWAWAAILWGLLKARPKQSRSLLPDVQAALGERDRTLEDGLDPFVNFMVNGRNLRQAESVISYYHPRVEVGLERAMAQKPGGSSRILGYLLDVLVELNAGRDDDWGIESAAHMLQAWRRQNVVPVKASPRAQNALDAWIKKRLSAPGGDFSNDLSLAADVGSASSTATQLAKWLLTMSRPRYAFGDRWSPDPDTDEWYQQMMADPLTEVICHSFVRRVLPFQNGGYPDNFADHIGRLAPNLTPTFLEVALSNLSRGYDPNAEVIAYGAIKDTAAFETVLSEAVAFREKIRAEDDPAIWLAIRNGEYDEPYAEHLGETAGQDEYTIDVFINTYVERVRESKGWTSLRDHPLLDGILYAWISSVRKDRGGCEEAELLALAEKCIGHRYEDHFWSIADGVWQASLTPQLVERMVMGHDSAEIRRAAANCFVRHAANSYNGVVRRLLATDARRLVEIFLDLREAWHDKEDRPSAEPFVNAALPAIPKEMAEVASLLIDNPKPAPSLTAPALDFVRTLDPIGRPRLALEKASMLVAAGEDASGLITTLVRSPRSDENDDIAYATAALELGITEKLWSLIEEALGHRFADVRKVALEALAARSTGPLPPDLLALASDKSSAVRRALVAILKDRPAPEHIDALVILADDTWSADMNYYGNEADYPIAQEAIAVLAVPPPLPERVLGPLFEISSKTQDPDVRSALIAAIAKNAGPLGVERVCDLAVSRESIKMSKAAAWAIFKAADKVDAHVAARLTVEHVARRNESVSVPMALAIGACAAPDQVKETSRALSVLPKRRALLLPLLLGAWNQDAALATEVARFFPAEVEATVIDTLTHDKKFPRDTFDDLADVRIVEEILRQLSSLFTPKPK